MHYCARQQCYSDAGEWLMAYAAAVDLKVLSSSLSAVSRKPLCPEPAEGDYPGLKSLPLPTLTDKRVRSLWLIQSLAFLLWLPTRVPIWDTGAELRFTRVLNTGPKQVHANLGEHCNRQYRLHLSLPLCWTTRPSKYQSNFLNFNSFAIFSCQGSSSWQQATSRIKHLQNYRGPYI